MSSKVAIVRTRPETAVDDVRRVMKLAGVAEALDSSVVTIIKNNLSWHLMYPGANTTPWQLEGTILGLRDAGLTDLVCVENGTVVTRAEKGEILNKQRPVCDRYGVPIKYNFRSGDMRWQAYQPKAKMLVLDRVFPKGIRIPDFFHGKNIVHLPTTKCHIYTNISGAMKNAFGGLLSNKRHYCHSFIHETLVDLLAIQKEIHSGIFAMMDGTTAGFSRYREAMQTVTDTEFAALSGMPPLGFGVEPTQFRGYGNDVQSFNSTGTGRKYFTITHTGQSNFAIILKDESERYIALLVNGIGPYSGKKPANLTIGKYYLDITADGAWTIDITST